MSLENLFDFSKVVPLVILLISTPAIADTRGGPIDPQQTSASEQHGEINQDIIARELAVFRAATTTLKDAALAVQRLHEGSIVADVSFDDVGGTPVYRVKTFEGQKVWENTVNGFTGSIQDAEVSLSSTDLSWQDRWILADVKEARASLPDAISAAERAAGGAAISGGSMTSEGKLSYVIVVSNGDDLKQFMLDPPPKLTPVTCRNYSGRNRRRVSC